MMENDRDYQNYQNEENGPAETDDEGYQYGYDYHYVEPSQPDEGGEAEQEHRKKGVPKRLLILIQLLVCGTALLLVMFLKLFGGAAYDQVRSWYLAHINDSIIAQEKMEIIRDACLRFFSPEAPGSGTSSSEAPGSGVSSSETPNAESGGAPASSASPSSGTSSAVPSSGVSSAAPSSNASGVENQKVNHSVSFTTNGSSQAPVMLSVFLDLPVKGGVITSGFGMRDGKHHDGIDIGAAYGSEICPALPGTVELCDENSSYGKYLIIDHGNQIKTRYAHCSSILAKEGDFVTYGQPVALIGSTGDSDGPHVHFELILSGICYDPQPLLKANRL